MYLPHALRGALPDAAAAGGAVAAGAVPRQPDAEEAVRGRQLETARGPGLRELTRVCDAHASGDLRARRGAEAGAGGVDGASSPSPA